MRIALPIALESLIGSSLNLVDNLMVGTLGEVELAAVGIGIEPFFIFWMVAYGFTGGTSAFVAQFYGANDIKNIKKTLGFSICVTMGISILFFIICRFFPEYIVDIYTDIEEIKPFAIEYITICSFSFLALAVSVPISFCLRAVQQPMIPLLTSVFAVCTSTFLNYVLIFGNFGAPALGVAGAAIATVIAWTLELLLLLIIVFCGKNMIAGKIKEYFGWSKDFASRVFHVAIPATANDTLWAIGSSLHLVAYGRLTTTEFAAVQIGDVIQDIFFVVAFSIGDAALILLGARLGAGELDYGYELAKKLLKIGTMIGLFLGGVLILTAKPIISIYNLTPEGQQYIFYILIIYGVSMCIYVFNGIVVDGVLRAGGDTKYALIADCSCVWGYGIPMAFITALLLKLPVHICIFLTNFEEVAKFFLLFKRVLSKKWVRTVIDDL